jgi:hypothetical protein
MYQDKFKIKNKLYKYRFKTLLNSNNFFKFYTFLISLDGKKKLSKLTIICNRRLNEGKFINQTLGQLRFVIKKIMYNNTKAQLETLPNFIDECLQDYCPDLIDCFTCPLENDSTALVGNIIYNDISKNCTFESSEGFDTNFQICIFSILNLNKTANNPPKNPYININLFKKLYRHAPSLFLPSDKITFKTFDETVVKLINDIEERIEYYKEKTSDITKIIKDFKLQMNQHKSLINNMSYINGKNASNFSKLCQELIHNIDVHNNQSVIGTLEYINQMIHQFRITNICENKEGYDKQL